MNTSIKNNACIHFYIIYNNIRKGILSPFYKVAMKNKNKFKKGFTIVELTVTISIVGIVGGVATFLLLNYNDKKEEQDLDIQANSLLSAYHKYYSLNEQEIRDNPASRGLYTFVMGENGASSYGFNKTKINFSFSEYNNSAYLFYSSNKTIVYQLSVYEDTLLNAENSILLYSEKPNIEIYDNNSEAYKSILGNDYGKLYLDNYTEQGKTALKVTEVNVEHTFDNNTTDVLYVPSAGSFTKDQYLSNYFYDYSTNSFANNALYKNSIAEENKITTPTSEIFKVSGARKNTVQNVNINGYGIDGDVVVYGNKETYIYDDKLMKTDTAVLNGDIYVSYRVEQYNDWENKSAHKDISLYATLDNLDAYVKQSLETYLATSSDYLNAYNKTTFDSFYNNGEILKFVTYTKNWAGVTKQVNNELKIYNKEIHLMNHVLENSMTLPNNYNIAIDFSSKLFQDTTATKFNLDPASVYNTYYGEFSQKNKNTEVRINPGVTITVPSNSKLLVTGIMKPNTNEAESLGAYSEILNNGTIILAENAQLYVFGKISGEGNIIAKSNSTITERGEILDYVNNANSFGNTAGPNQGTEFIQSTHLSNACSHAYYMNDNSALTHAYRRYAQPMFLKTNITGIENPITFNANVNYNTKYIYNYGELRSFDYNLFGTAGFLNITGDGILARSTNFSTKHLTYQTIGDVSVDNVGHLDYDIYFDKAGGTIRMSSRYMPVSFYNTSFIFNEGSTFNFDNANEKYCGALKLQVLPSSELVFNKGSNMIFGDYTQVSSFKTSDYDWYTRCSGELTKEQLDVVLFNNDSNGLIKIDDQASISIKGILAGCIDASNINERFNSIIGNKYNYTLSYLKQWGNVFNFGGGPKGDFSCSDAISIPFTLTK